MASQYVRRIESALLRDVLSDKVKDMIQKDSKDFSPVYASHTKVSLEEQLEGAKGKVKHERKKPEMKEKVL